MDVRPGAYGYLIAGIDGGDMLAVGGAAAWPVLTVSTGIESRDGPRRVELGPNRASIDTLGARLVLEREPVSVTVLARSRLPEADLVHPSLWPAAAVFARWRGLETLHSGAFVDDRGERGRCSATAAPARARCSPRSCSRGTLSSPTICS